VVDVATGKVLLEFNAATPLPIVRHPTEAAFSPDGRRFAAVVSPSPGGPDDWRRRDRVRVRDLDSGKELCAPLEVHALADAPFSPDGSRLVTVKLNGAGARGTVRVSVWDVARGKEAAGWDVPPPTMLYALTGSPDGTRVAGVTGERPLRVKDFSHPRTEARSV